MTTTTITTLDNGTTAADDTENSIIKTLLACSLLNPSLTETFHAPRFRLRLAMIRAWAVRPGERLLDIGCGQGESLLALAAAVGPHGHVTGLDTASMDYGHPFTMRDAHAHIRASELGPRTSFFPLDADAFFARHDTDDKNSNSSSSSKIDAAVLCQSLFYFADEDKVRALFGTLARRAVGRLYVAEWTYEASGPEQEAHILAARAQALFFRRRAPREPALREQNVRVGVDRACIVEAARGAGYRETRTAVLVPGDDMREGQFEVDRALSDKFERQVAAEGLGPEVEGEIRELVGRLREEVAKGRGGFARAMDVWCAVFELGPVGGGDGV